MKTKKEETNPYEYEDFGSPSLYFAAIATVIFMIAFIILFAMVIAAGVIYIGASI